MLPSIQHGTKSRVSLYNVIPPIGASIHNFRNRDEKLWPTLQHIREMEKTVSEQKSPRELSPVTALKYLLTIQDSDFVETSSKKAPEGSSKNFAKNDKMANEKCHGDIFDVPTSPCYSEVEFSIAVDNVRPLVLRYSSSDQESSDDSEALNVLENSLPDNSFKDKAVQKVEGKAAFRQYDQHGEVNTDANRISKIRGNSGLHTN